MLAKVCIHAYVHAFVHVRIHPPPPLYCSIGRILQAVATELSANFITVHIADLIHGEVCPILCCMPDRRGPPTGRPQLPQGAPTPKPPPPPRGLKFFEGLGSGFASEHPPRYRHTHMHKHKHTHTHPQWASGHGTRDPEGSDVEGPGQ